MHAQMKNAKSQKLKIANAKIIQPKVPDLLHGVFATWALIL